jgi:hypothetical protein
MNHPVLVRTPNPTTVSTSPLTIPHTPPSTPHSTLTPAPQDPSQDDNHKRFALLCIGELGRRADLTAHPALPDVLTAALGSGARRCQAPLSHPPFMCRTRLAAAVKLVLLPKLV